MNEKEGKEPNNNEKEVLTDYELSDHEYHEALELDKRNFLKTYWYLLKRELIIIYTSFNWTDFNLFCNIMLNIILNLSFYNVYSKKLITEYYLIRSIWIFN